MEYCVRYIVAEGSPPTLAALREGLTPLSPDYSLELEDRCGTLAYQGTPIARIEICCTGDALFDKERDLLLGFLAATTADRKEEIELLLKGATGAIAARLHSADDDPAMMLQWLEPVWGWLFANYRGVLQVDGQGYYDGSGPVLRFE